MPRKDKFMTDNYNILINKLDAFIRKYYKNQIIRGALYSLATLLIFFLAVTLLEYFAWFGTTARTVIFYLYLAVSVFIIFKLILIPLFKLFRIGKIISHHQAAQIIGKHFSNVEDRLLNTLQLKALSNSSTENADLIRASIDQRIAELKPVPFSNAIDLKSNRRYLRYALPPLIVVVIFLLAAPSIITEPTERIIRHSEYFEKAAPFSFRLLNDDLNAVQQDNFTVEMQIDGERVPDAVTIYSNGTPFRMKKKNTISFVHTFRNVQNAIDFNFEADGVKSEMYKLNVLPRPIVLNFETEIDYPKYTGRQDEVLQNTGDLILPEGSSVKWKFYTRDTDELDMRFNDSLYPLNRNNSNVFAYQGKFFKSQPYSISTRNNYLKNNDSLVFAISVIPDVYPTISIEEFNDSVVADRLYFRGFIKDDYGFSKLGFYYKHKSAIDSLNTDGFVPEPLRLQANVNQQQFFYNFDINQLNLQAGDEVEYYFEVWDNDAVNGHKAARSQKMIFKAPTKEELKEKTEAANQDIKDNMENALKDLQLLQQDIDEMSRKMFEKKTLNWQDKQQIEDLLNRQQSIQERIENLQKENENKLRQQEQYEKPDEALMQKQQELQQLMNQVMDDEMKKLMDEIQKMLDELDKDKINEKMEEMKMSNKDLEEQLDRSLELFKQLEFEQKLQETIDKLKELAEEQDKLSEETKQEKDGNNNEDIQKKQDDLNKQFDDLQKDIDDLEKKNQELENPNQMENTDQQQQEIQDEMQQSSEQLQQNQNNKASGSQKNAAQKMEQLSQQMQQMMDNMMMQQMGEDINALREILENLVQISFDQEDLMNAFGDLNINDPKYTQTIKDQMDLKDDMKIVADSLKALSKRQIMIKPFVTKELNSIDRNFDRALESMDNRRKGRTMESQQLVMTSVNNLALLLGESLEQMQQQMMQMQSSGSASCPNPGKPGGAQQMKSMKGLQEQLNKQLQEMREGQKPGQQGQQGQQMSEKLARLAAQQAAIRRKMEEFRDQLKEETGTSDGNVSKMINDMEKTEKDIVNRQITRETMKRQQEILSRLLKSERAELEREQEQKRESREAVNPKISNPGELFEFDKMKNREVELLKTLPPNLNPFYKNKVTEYFYRFE